MYRLWTKSQTIVRRNSSYGHKKRCQSIDDDEMRFHLPFIDNRGGE